MLLSPFLELDLSCAETSPCRSRTHKCLLSSVPLPRHLRLSNIKIVISLTFKIELACLDKFLSLCSQLARDRLVLDSKLRICLIINVLFRFSVMRWKHIRWFQVFIHHLRLAYFAWFASVAWDLLCDSYLLIELNLFASAPCYLLEGMGILI